MRPVRILGGALLWAGGVVTVASLSWVAINSAGRQVVDQTLTVGQLDTPRAQNGVHPVPTQGRSPSPTVTTRVGTATDATPSAVPTGGGASGTVAAPTGRPMSETTVETRTASPAPRPTATLVPVQDSKQTLGGVVSVECTGRLLTDYLVQPYDGWAGHDRRGTSDLTVSFTRSHAQIEVRATCVSGRPAFAVATGGEHDD